MSGVRYQVKGSNLQLSMFSADEEFLHILNTSSVKDLQSLQTVGAKRAKLIFEWRETYGSFTMVRIETFS